MLLTFLQSCFLGRFHVRPSHNRPVVTGMDKSAAFRAKKLTSASHCAPGPHEFRAPETASLRVPSAQAMPHLPVLGEYAIAPHGLSAPSPRRLRNKPVVGSPVTVRPVT